MSLNTHGNYTSDMMSHGNGERYFYRKYLERAIKKKISETCDI